MINEKHNKKQARYPMHTNFPLILHFSFLIEVVEFLSHSFKCCLHFLLFAIVRLDIYYNISVLQTNNTNGFVLCEQKNVKNNLQFRRHVTGQHLNAFCIACFAQYVIVHGIAAATFSFR